LARQPAYLAPVLGFDTAAEPRGCYDASDADMTPSLARDSIPTTLTCSMDR